jgi:hypothetical protein
MPCQQRLRRMDLTNIPYGLNTEELGRFLREHAAKIRFPARRMPPETTTDIAFRLYRARIAVRIRQKGH